MALNPTTKKWLVRGGTGAVGLVLCIVAMTQCSGKNAERYAKDAALAECDSVKKELAKSGRIISSLQENLQTAQRKLAELQSTNEDCGALVGEYQDSMTVYLDSIAVLNQRLADCQKKKKAVKKPAAKKKAKQSVSVHCGQKPAQRSCPTAPVSNSARDANVNVNNGGCNNTNITNINNGGTVNNYYGTPAPKKNDCTVTYRRTRTIQITVEKDSKCR